MKIKLDENISRHLKPHLQQEGYDVFTAAEEGLLGKSDVEVGAAAKSERLILFTYQVRGKLQQESSVFNPAKGGTGCPRIKYGAGFSRPA